MRGTSHAFTIYVLDEVKAGRIEPKHLKRVFEVFLTVPFA